jgi:prevent-host-death family protein
MAEVKIGELREKLDHYLKLARQGEQVVVTEDGKPVAVISPTGQTPEEAAMWKLVAQGKVRWSGGKPKGSAHPVKLRGGPSMAQTVIEGREE